MTASNEAKRTLVINGVHIDDSFAEAFRMRAARLLVTAANLTWARHAAESMTGFATSVIGCGCEAAIEAELGTDETPDGRPGLSVLLFAVSTEMLGKQIETRVGQCILTAPTSAVYSGLVGEESVPLGKNLRFFGDGYQVSKQIGGRRFWRVPVMDGEFVCEEIAQVVKAVGGGNFLVIGNTVAQTLLACEAAVAAMRQCRGVIMPFPGGVVRSGSKVGSKYKKLPASTNDAFCPTLKGVAQSELGADDGAVLEIVIDGLDERAIEVAMRLGIQAVCALGSPAGIRRVAAGNYGGKLGKFHFYLHEVLSR
jgi:formylmethanofuran--tetrahydromethanopterin N-formyltransferase